MKTYQYQLNCELWVQPESFLTVADRLELSLPCINCQRDHRTVIFEGIDSPGICTPVAQCSGFPGKMTSHEIAKKTDHVLIQHQINFDYEPFIDRKYHKESTFTYGWARIRYALKYPARQLESAFFTQENVSRPWLKKCRCGEALHLEKKSPFRYQTIQLT